MNLKEFIDRQKDRSEKSAFITLTHLSHCRAKKELNDMSKIEIVVGFASLWDLLESEMSNVMIKEEKYQSIKTAI